MARKRKTNDTADDSEFSKILAIIGVVLAIGTLILAWQSNQLSIEGTSSSPQITTKAFDRETMMTVGCQTKDDYFWVRHYIANEFTISNSGGRAVSLVNARLVRGDNELKVKAFLPQSFDARNPSVPSGMDEQHGIVFSESLANAILVPTKAEPIIFPLKLESGLGERWLFQADDTDTLSAENDAILAVSDTETGEDKITWVFEFSDGTILNHETAIASYSYNPSLLQGFPDCEEE